ncbi:hypothetical protein THAOC_35003 [Thalassiosira oceanica]|uniref:Uncharacterized protein n=1 Tax=Thalassiosira oceanica TaxID=159749 RepID=K0R2J6_THAOC|nr:hypothetical protein THAOC_35003 [Thalassiosira oceanica]|eukprot:EJK46330.1 hypothetical protein THAOC_35003 [Thalassiosira oceanica]
MDDVGGRSPSPPPLKGNPDDVGDLPPSAEDVLVVDAKPSTLASPSNDKDTGINSKRTEIYNQDVTFSREELAMVTPKDVYEELRAFVNRIKEMQNKTPKRKKRSPPTTTTVPRAKRAYQPPTFDATGNSLVSAATLEQHQERLISASAEVETLINQMRAQKKEFISSLGVMSAAVEKMRRDVETSFTMMLGEVSKIATNVSATKIRVRAISSGPSSSNTDSTASLVLPIQAQQEAPTIRSMLISWSLTPSNQLTPLDSSFVFPSNASVLKMMTYWFIGDIESKAPPFRFLIASHMKHIKGLRLEIGRVRRVLKVIKYLALRCGFWVSDWTPTRVTLLWEKVSPSLSRYFGDAPSKHSLSRDMPFKTLFNQVAKTTSIQKDMTDNPDVLKSADVVKAVVAETEELLLANASAANSEKIDLEFLYGIHNGRLNPLPSTWAFPWRSIMLSCSTAGTMTANGIKTLLRRCGEKYGVNVFRVGRILVMRLPHQRGTLNGKLCTTNCMRPAFLKEIQVKGDDAHEQIEDVNAGEAEGVAVGKDTIEEIATV